MKNILLSILLIGFLNVTSLAQKVLFEKDFEVAKKLSQAQNKPLFIVFAINFSMQGMPKLPDALKDISINITNPIDILEDKEVSSKLNKNFINFKVDYEPNNSTIAIKNLVNAYKLSSFPAFVFIDSKGGILLKEYGVQTPSKNFISVIDKALVTAKQKSIVEYDAEFASGNYNPAFLKEYIGKRIIIGNYDNANLIEKYVTFLSVKDLSNYNEVLFILQAGPYLDGVAYKLAYTNKNIIDSIYGNEKANVRFAFNNRIITNSFNDAVTNKSITKAYLVANFVRGTWSNNYKEGNKQSTNKLIQYYFAVKDYDNYLKQASYYYDQYYMNVSLDSIKKEDEDWAENLKSQLENLKTSNSLNNSTPFNKTERITKVTTVNRSLNAYANGLNNAAYNFYLTKTKNTTYLTKAMLWCKKSIELCETAAFYDTLAHLVYALGFYAEAETTQQKAIDFAKIEGQNLKPFEDELVKMKNQTL